MKLVSKESLADFRRLEAGYSAAVRCCGCQRIVGVGEQVYEVEVAGPTFASPKVGDWLCKTCAKGSEQ